MSGKAKQHADGIYLNLPEDEYHADDALGSSAIKQLKLGADEYWWQSPFNPARPESDGTEAQKVGSAYHKIVLEGRPAFDAVYTRRPDDEPGATSSDKGALTRSASAAAAKLGKESLKGGEYDRVIVASAMIAQHPDLSTAFTGGLSEVSVFWTERMKIVRPVTYNNTQAGITEMEFDVEIRCKARFDYLKQRGIGDLKSVVNERRRPFAQACKYAIRDYRHDLQVAHYLQARAVMPRLPIHGATPDETAKLMRICAAPDFAFQFVFIQKTGAPRTWSRVYSPENKAEGRGANPLLTAARVDREAALETWAIAATTFGTYAGKAWMNFDPVEEMSEDEMPPNYF